MQRLIYEPAGAAREYAPLAANLYSGCTHGCTYCYVPRCLRRTREDFHARAVPAPDVLTRLTHDAWRLSGDPRPVFLCFACDPYPPIESSHCITREALHILGDNDLNIRVLTKNGELAQRDFDLMLGYGVEFGQTVIWSLDDTRLEYEPLTCTLSQRYEAAREAFRAGIYTWLSLEPVIAPAQALAVLQRYNGIINHWRIGKLNHDPQREAAIDWRLFVRQVLERLADMPGGYYIKHTLWAFADEETRARYPQCRSSVPF